MSRRDELRKFFLGTGPAEPVAEAPSPVAAPEPAGVARAMRRSLGDLARHAEDLERRVADGAVVVELDTGLVDPSFAADRLADDGALKGLIASMRESGQRTPILVRPHPEAAGRYQVAFGHRRLAAAKALGRPVKAIVESLSDAELVVAQGQENAERRDLSYIERALFMAALAARGFDRDTQMRALGVESAEISRFLAVLRDVPEVVVRAIGPAPGQGRRRWLALGAALRARGVGDEFAGVLSALPDFSTSSSDARFETALLLLTESRTEGKNTYADGIRDRELRAASGRVVARIKTTRTGIVVSIDRRVANGTAVEAALKAFEAALTEPTS